MKKTRIFLAVFLSLCCFAGCGNNDSSSIKSNNDYDDSSIAESEEESKDIEEDSETKEETSEKSSSKTGSDYEVGDVLFESDFGKITYLGIDNSDGKGGMLKVKVKVENNLNIPIAVFREEASINDIMMGSGSGSVIMNIGAKKSVEDTFEFDKNRLALYGVKTVDNIEFKLFVDEDNLKDIGSKEAEFVNVYSDSIIIPVNEELLSDEDYDYCRSDFQVETNPQVVYESDKIKVEYVGITGHYDNMFNNKFSNVYAILKIDNLTNKTLQCCEKDISIDGMEYPYSDYCTVLSGNKTVYHEINLNDIYEKYDNTISIGTLITTFYIRDSEDNSILEETPPLEISINREIIK